jgi:predicted acylesterase/phospholipase RssA
MSRILTVLLLLGVGVFTGLRAGGSCGPGFMLRLEFAADAPRMLELIDGCGITAFDVRKALGWDFAFLICYGALIAIAAAFAGRRAGGRWENIGAMAAFASFLGAGFDALENTALLHALELGDNATLAAKLGAFAAGAKFLLVLPAAGFALVALIAAVLAWLRSGPPEALPDPVPLPKGVAERPLTCDVVMKGGITSGVVYPSAIARLSQTYRFVNIGGASAGAIAASATAAAEYARANGRDGFATLDQLPAWLGGGDRLFRLFRPSPATRAPFEIFAAFLGNVAGPFKLARAFAAGLWHLPIAALLGLVPGGVLIVAALCTRSPALPITGAVALTIVLLPLALVVGLALTVLWRLPQHGFGMCSGRGRPGQIVLSQWLADLLGSISGVKGRPLIFADLWTAGESHADVDKMRAEAARVDHVRKINFEALTTSLAHGRPYRMPELRQLFYFRREDLAEVLPDDVVQWMVEHPAAPDPKIKLPAGYLRLPDPHDLPVVFAARLSLSFPFLISAVKLWGIDGRRPANLNRREDQEVQLDVNWMSDGGIASNFPIHFFDALVPGRPTFGLDLATFHPDWPRKPDQSKNVFLPGNNASGFQESWNHFEGLFGFVGALVNAIQAFLDNMQARAPGFRDRIARIHLEKQEGGLNLAMPPTVLKDLGDRGRAAADKILKRFVEATPSGWENHRWVRLRLLLGQVDPLLRHFSKGMKESPMPDDPPSYDWENKQQRATAEAVIADLIAIGDRLNAAQADLQKGSPKPVPELRISPRV